MGEETLLIVGNGFDLSMGFKTSYGDFMKSSFFPNEETSTLCSYLHKQYEENMGWIDIENELSKYSKLLSRYELTPETGKIEMGAEFFREEYEELKSSLKSYLQEETKGAFATRQDNPAKRVIDNLPADSKIISFNYTSIIERMTRNRFSASKGNLFHIHGSLAPCDDIVFGVDASPPISGRDARSLLDGIRRFQRFAALLQHHVQCSSYATSKYVRLPYPLRCSQASRHYDCRWRLWW